MFQKWLPIITITSIIVAGLLQFVSTPQIAEAHPTTRIVQNDTTLLQSTIRIVMLSKEGQDTVATPSLGTLVEDNGRKVIVTHNHWSALRNETLVEVQISTLDGTTITNLSARHFISAKLYSDPGTLIFSAPTETLLPQFRLKFVGKVGTQSIQAGDNLQFVFGHATVVGGTFSVETISVDELTYFNDTPAVKLSHSTALQPQKGNSGAAIFINGQFVGNLWVSVVTSDAAPTGMSIAALFPILQ